MTASPLLPRAVYQVLDLPAERLAAAIGAWPEPAILTSGAGFGDAGRWTVLAAYPRLVFEATAKHWSLRTDTGAFETGQGDPFAELEQLARRFDLATPTDLVEPADGSFRGGLIGFLGYDLAPLLERLPRKAPRDSRLPDIRMALYDTAVVVDNSTGKVVLHAWDLTDEGQEATERRCRFWRRALKSALETPRLVRLSSVGPLDSNFDRERYLETVRRTLEYIAAGDVFQINLSQRFAARGTIVPLDLFLRLTEASPAPFSAYLGWRDLAVVSASPEQFYQTLGERVVTRPIKGTRPRGGDAEDDRRLAAELAGSPKDRAELTMIVDLERNDLGRVCQYGSVRVSDPLTVETFAQVHHLVATVEGRLRSDVSPVDLMRATVPGWVDHRRTEDPGNGDHRRAGAQPPESLHRHDRLSEPRRRQASSTSRSGRCSWKGFRSATRSVEGSWPIPIRPANTRRRFIRAGPSGPSWKERTLAS